MVVELCAGIPEIVFVVVNPAMYYCVRMAGFFFIAASGLFVCVYWIVFLHGAAFSCGGTNDREMISCHLRVDLNNPVCTLCIPRTVCTPRKSNLILRRVHKILFKIGAWINNLGTLQHIYDIRRDFPQKISVSPPPQFPFFLWKSSRPYRKNIRWTGTARSHYGAWQLCKHGWPRRWRKCGRRQSWWASSAEHHQSWRHGKPDNGIPERIAITTAIMAI